MLKNISIRGAAIACLLVVPNVALAGTTQIVVQWNDGQNSLSMAQVFRVQGVLDGHVQQGGCDSDGNDIGSGTQNFYLYADDTRVGQVVKAVIDMQRQKLLPSGLRIGVAVYKDAARKDWIYKPVYPVTLKHFDIM